jgi:outer membrane protein OmpA-like peptidoglycan-associated protein
MMTARLKSVVVKVSVVIFALFPVGALASGIQAEGGVCSPSETHEQNNSEYTVYFSTNSFIVTAKEKLKLKAAAACAIQRGATSVSIIGHTDQVGSEVYNLWLSRQRTQAVLLVMNGYGISNNILHADWKGKSESSTTPTPATPQPLDRRVTVKLSF